MKISDISILEKIDQTVDERTLLSLAYFCRGMLYSHQMSPKDYAACMVALGEKLGFGPTGENLENAAAKYIQSMV